MFLNVKSFLIKFLLFVALRLIMLNLYYVLCQTIFICMLNIASLRPFCHQSLLLFIYATQNIVDFYYIINKMWLSHLKLNNNPEACSSIIKFQRKNISDGASDIYLFTSDERVFTLSEVKIFIKYNGLVMQPGNNSL